LLSSSFSAFRKTDSAFRHRILQPAQLVAWQEEHPDDRERTVPSPVRLRLQKVEYIFSTSRERHFGQVIPFSALDPKISCSNSRWHFVQRYSNIGMVSLSRAASPPGTRGLYESVQTNLFYPG